MFNLISIKLKNTFKKRISILQRHIDMFRAEGSWYLQFTHMGQKKTTKYTNTRNLKKI